MSLQTAVEEREEFYKAYEEHSKTLRTWLVAYGVGAPVLFFTNEQLAQSFARAPEAVRISAFFLGGVVLQVVLAAVNKTVNWAAYFALRRPGEATGRRFRVARWIAEQFWIDLLIDALSLVAFGFATWWSVSLLMPAT